MAAIGMESTINIVVDLVAAVAVLGCFILQGKLNKTKKYGYLTYIISECMDKHKPLGFVVDRSGKMIPFIEENSIERPGLAKPPKDTKFTLVSPDMVKPHASMELLNGPKVLMYSLPYHFPISVQSAAALSQLGRLIGEHPRLSRFNNDIKIVELLFNNTETFGPNCRAFVESSVDYGAGSRKGTIPYEVRKEPEPVEEEEEEFEEEDEYEEEGERQ